MEETDAHAQMVFKKDCLRRERLVGERAFPATSVERGPCRGFVQVERSTAVCEKSSKRVDRNKK